MNECEKGRGSKAERAVERRRERDLLFKLTLFRALLIEELFKADSILSAIRCLNDATSGLEPRIFHTACKVREPELQPLQGLL